MAHCPVAHCAAPFPELENGAWARALCPQVARGAGSSALALQPSQARLDPSRSRVSPMSHRTRPRVWPTPEQGQNEAKACGLAPRSPDHAGCSPPAPAPLDPSGRPSRVGASCHAAGGCPGPPHARVSSHTRPQGGRQAGQGQEGIVGGPSNAPNIWTRKVGHTGLPGQVRNGGYRKAYQGERRPPKLVSARNLRMRHPGHRGFAGDSTRTRSAWTHAPAPGRPPSP